ncbi:wax ester/triacylglycerol synthase domain-containing protein [Arthrobacter sp. TMS1-12-1]
MTTRPGPRLAPVDEANLVLDHAGQVNVFLVTGLFAAGGFVRPDDVPDLGVVRAAVRERLAAVPQLCRLPVRDGRRHRWAEVLPDLDHHVRLVDAVAGRAGLERLCGELMTTPLPRDLPPWELLLVPGAGPVGMGLVLRIHHVLADGLGAVAVVQQLFDPDGASTPPAASRPVTAPRPRRTLRSALAGRAEGWRRIRLTLRGGEVGSTLLLGERSPRRGVAFLDADLGALQAHARPVGATVNDTLLSAAAAGYRAALAQAGEEIPAGLPVSVPVALQRRGPSANHVGVMLVRLPLGEPDPEERLRRIAAQTRTGKVKAREQGTLELMRGPVGARVMDRAARNQHLVAGFVTDVPGPPGTLRLAGAPLTAVWPVAVLAANVRLGVAAVSYSGHLRCGVHFDAATVPGAEFADGMREELARLAGPPS